MNRHALRSRRVLSEGDLAPRTVVIEDGQIAALEPYDAVGEPGLPVVDLGDLVLMAGLTDVHVHINEPGRTDWEGFATATRAAAAGGVTTLIDMPLNSSPVTVSAEAFGAKLQAAEGQLRVDVGFWGGLVPSGAEDLPGLLASGVLGLKAFLVHSGIEDFPNVGALDLDRALPLLAPTGLPLLVHCELDASGRPEPAGTPDPRSYQQYLASRPARWELDAIELVLNRARATGARVHIVHLSAAEALPLLRQAKADGLAVTVETCPQYLVLEAETIPDGDTRFKCAPPIRDHANREALWQGLADGTIDLIATDHSPCPPGLKQLDTGDFTKAWGGIASVQFLLPLVWTEARARGFGWADLERWVCQRPALLAGWGQTKGRLLPGYRADLVAWDPEAAFVVAEQDIVYRHRITPYAGRRLQGRVHATWLAGHPVWREGAPVGTPRGQTLLRRTAWLDGLGETEARAVLTACCGSTVWVDRLMARRPFGTFLGLSRAATEVWDALDRADRLQAFAAHPRIGHRAQQHREQAGVVGAPPAVLDRLREANDEYFDKFGFVFLVFATGRSAEQMLALLEARLRRSQDEEEAEAARQHHRITLFRLAQQERTL